MNHLDKLTIPPAFDSRVAGELFPTTPQWTSRYDGRGFVETKPLDVPSVLEQTSNSFALPAYLPPSWTQQVHPEGQLYFIRESSLRIVTECNLYDAYTRSKVEYWAKFIEAKLMINQLADTAHLEVFVKPIENDCEYYIADYTRRTLVWLSALSTEELGMGSAASASHLALSLEGLFWTHLEYFPRPALGAQDINNLICIFNHALADQMTSDGSTFPYPRRDCEAFVGLLKNARESPQASHHVVLVSRLWGVILQHRFATHYGQPLSRLTRDQSIVHAPSSNLRTARFVGALTCGLAKHYSKKLDDVFLDRYVYVEQWQILMATCIREWQENMAYTALGLLFQLALSSMPGSSVLTSASLVGLIFSMIFSILLIYRHRGFPQSSANDGHVYLSSVYSSAHQFHFVALAYALPALFHMLGVGLLVLDIFSIISVYFGLTVFISVACSVAVVFFMFSYVLGSVSLPSFRRAKMVKADNIV
ncbi:hypothetical protein CYLTODRAFT_423214 [Cylindrobasidium torrendii FP15055 ss-10]|uniref:WW domain-containing protein n=1 Tax=Cylindrobasidium torrendii FP15055 ss-10 TaxID=1314674 RepID=A0A0D7B977_9AGAR|nr:hypothetical protein CYLTODRAFT_423214 [Cylindrobasidium torrendii FP15055 ss-10]